jgi:trimethylamine--corrinoid protein Co-methyltransferase
MAIDTLVLPHMSMLTRDQCEEIHRASLEVLRRTGVRFFHAGALDLLRRADGAQIDGDRVRFQARLVEWALAQVPPRIPLCKRGTAQVIAPLEGQIVSFGTGSDCLTYLDPRTGERRPFVSQDVIDCIHVTDAMQELQFCMSMGIPSDVKTNTYRAQFAMMLEHTSKPVVFVCNDRADCEAIVAMSSAAAGGIERLRLNPSILLYGEPSSPLRHSFTAMDKLIYMAQQDLPMLYSPAPVQGGTAPVTLAGGLVQANAELLSGLVVHQLTRPGAPIVYGCGMHHLDMKTTTSVYTCPEFVLARVAVAEMGRFYGMPTWGYAGDVNSCVVDEQAAAEGTFSIMAALLAGNNLTHDVGYLESGLTTSPEMIVLCDETISMVQRFTQGFSLDSTSLALDVIDQVGPDGDYLTSRHTLKHFRELWRPRLFSRLGGEAWADQGSQRLGSRLRDKTLSIIDGHTPEPLPDSVKQAIHDILQA